MDDRPRMYDSPPTSYTNRSSGGHFAKTHFHIQLFPSIHTERPLVGLSFINAGPTILRNSALIIIIMAKHSFSKHYHSGTLGLGLLSSRQSATVCLRLKLRTKPRCYYYSDHVKVPSSPSPSLFPSPASTPGSGSKGLRFG